MPRQLLRDGRVVADDWTYLDDAGTVASAEGGVIFRWPGGSPNDPRGSKLRAASGWCCPPRTRSSNSRPT